MPKVGQFRFYLDELKMLDVWYKRGEGFSLKGLPQEFVTLTGFRNSFATESKMSEAVYEAIQLYRELKTKERISILYKCSATAEVRMNKISKGFFSGTAEGVSEKIDDMQGTHGYGFSIEFKKVKIIDNGDKPVYYEIDTETGEMDKYPRNYKGYGSDDFQEIPFTEERLQFFIGISEAMKKMIVQLSKFFGSDQEQATLFIDNKQKLLQ